MKTKILFLSLVVLALALSSCGGGAKEWSEFSSTEGGFSVSLPGKPTEQKQTQDTAAGPLDIFMYLYEDRSDVYMVGYTNFPEDLISLSDPAALLDGGAEGAVTSMGAENTSKQEISLDGNTGREITFDVPDSKLPGGGAGKARFYLVGNRLYQLIGLAKGKEASTDNLDKFLDSFKLLK